MRELLASLNEQPGATSEEDMYSMIMKAPIDMQTILFQATQTWRG